MNPKLIALKAKHDSINRRIWNLRSQLQDLAHEATLVREEIQQVCEHKETVQPALDGCNYCICCGKKIL